MTDDCGWSDHRRRVAAGSQLIPDRRRPGQSEKSAAETFHQMPAAVVLERMPVAVAAIDRQGAILFANTAFAALLGHTRDSIERLTFDQIVSHPVDDPEVNFLNAYADQGVDLVNREGFAVRARMSKSAMRRHDDLALITFDDLTEQQWTMGH
jgi:PAS domain S-box-containing protein